MINLVYCYHDIDMICICQTEHYTTMQFEEGGWGDFKNQTKAKRCCSSSCREAIKYFFIQIFTTFKRFPCCLMLKRGLYPAKFLVCDREATIIKEEWYFLGVLSTLGPNQSCKLLERIFECLSLVLITQK